jgi:hypothetical protein
MIAALSGSTAVLVIGVFHALLAGNGRLIDARMPVDVDCFRVVAVLVPDAPAAVTCAPETDADADDVVADAEVVAPDGEGLVADTPSTDGAAWNAGVAAFALCVDPCVQPLASITTATRAAGST